MPKSKQYVIHRDYMTENYRVFNTSSQRYVKGSYRLRKDALVRRNELNARTDRIDGMSA